MGSRGPDVSAGLLGDLDSNSLGLLSSLFGSGADLPASDETFRSAPPRFGMDDIFAGSGAVAPFVPGAASMPSTGSPDWLAAPALFGGPLPTFQPTTTPFSSPPGGGVWPGANDTLYDTPAFLPAQAWPASGNGILFTESPDWLAALASAGGLLGGAQSVPDRWGAPDDSESQLMNARGPDLGVTSAGTSAAPSDRAMPSMDSPDWVAAPAPFGGPLPTSAPTPLANGPDAPFSSGPDVLAPGTSNRILPASSPNYLAAPLPFGGGAGTINDPGMNYGVASDPGVEIGRPRIADSNWLDEIGTYLGNSAEALSRAPRGFLDIGRDLVTDPLLFLQRAGPGLAGVTGSIPFVGPVARLNARVANGATAGGRDAAAVADAPAILGRGSQPAYGSYPPASSFVGSQRAPLQATAGPPRNSPGEFNGVPYSGHAFDQMQNRGIPPHVVDRAVRTGIGRPGKEPGTTRYYDPVNNVSVIRDNRTGNVITLRSGD